MKRIIYETLMVLTMGVLLISCDKEGCICTYTWRDDDEVGKEREYIERDWMLEYYGVKTCSALAIEYKKELKEYLKEHGDETRIISVRCK